MAAIDKIYVKHYYDFESLRLWCLIHKPSLLKSFYKPFMTQNEWDIWKEEKYQRDKEVIENMHTFANNVENLRNHYKELGKNEKRYIPNNEQLLDEVTYHKEQYAKIQNKERYIANIQIPITNFRLNEDKYLLWRCPIDFVREYLKENCGYETKWYHKLFFTD